MSDQRLCWSSTGAVMVESGASKIILKTNDVVLAQIAAALHFDEDEILRAGVFDAMRSANGDVDRFTVANSDVAAVESHLCCTGNNVPMFRALCVFLVTQTFSGQHFDPFDFESWCFFQNGVGAPRPSIKFSHCLDSPARHLSTKKPPADYLDPRAAFLNHRDTEKKFYELARSVT